MTKIKLYSTDSNPKMTDKVIGTEVDSNGITKNYLLGGVYDLFNGTDVTAENTEILSGTVYHIAGLRYGYTAFVYRIGGTLYSIEKGEVSLSANSDPTNSRIDVFAVTDTPSLVVLEGTPANPALEEAIDFGSQIRISEAIIGPLAGLPTGLSEEQVYEENAGEPTEWTTSESSGLVIDVQATTDPSVGTIHIECLSDPTGESVTFTNDTTVSKDFSSLYFEIKNVSSERLKMAVLMYNGTDLVSRPSLVVANGTYGYQSSNTTSYQEINIPAEDLSPQQDFDRITIIFKVEGNPTGFTGPYIDNVILKSGVENPQSGKSIAIRDNGLLIDGDVRDINIKGAASISQTSAGEVEADVGGLLVSSVSFNSAQWGALNSSPGTLLTSSSATTYYLPVMILFEYTYGTTPYVGPTSITVYFESLVGAPILSLNPGPFFKANDTATLHQIDKTTTDPNIVLNEDILITVDSDFTGGDGTVTVHTFYREFSTV